MQQKKKRCIGRSLQQVRRALKKDLMASEAALREELMAVARLQANESLLKEKLSDATKREMALKLQFAAIKETVHVLRANDSLPSQQQSDAASREPAVRRQGGSCRGSMSWMQPTGEQMHVSEVNESLPSEQLSARAVGLAAAQASVNAARREPAVRNQGGYRRGSLSWMQSKTASAPIN